jgi:hypothetical protein
MVRHGNVAEVTPHVLNDMLMLGFVKFRNWVLRIGFPDVGMRWIHDHGGQVKYPDNCVEESCDEVKR